MSFSPLTREQLEAEVEQLRAEIARTEKFAALGAIVAGLSHEINTPIGNAFLTASSLQDKARRLSNKLEHGLKRSQLVQFINDIGSHCDLLLRNLEKANDLIGGFKQMSVDQTSAQRRGFELSEVVRDVALSMRPSFRSRSFQLIYDIEPGIVFDSYPGPLGQILINLINNALLHAFEGRQSGQMKILARRAGADQVELRFSDNGVGIPPTHLGKIFESFFTTRMGQGGSGLGLNIVRHIATDILGGAISVESSPGAGTAFILRLPLCAPPYEGATDFPVFGEVLHSNQA